jgi:RNA polymerase sigma factor (sigma-70 family)
LLKDWWIGVAWCRWTIITTLRHSSATRSRAIISPFQKLLSRYHTRLIAALAPQIPSDATKAIEPEDVCQEAYAAAARDLDRFESRGVDSFFAWLLTIARHRLLDMLRALRAEKRSGQLAMVEILGHNAGSTICLLEQFAADSHTPSRSVAARELVESVRFALERLPSNQQDAVRMRYVEACHSRTRPSG